MGTVVQFTTPNQSRWCWCAPNQKIMQSTFAPEMCENGRLGSGAKPTIFVISNQQYENVLFIWSKLVIYVRVRTEKGWLVMKLEESFKYDKNLSALKTRKVSLCHRVTFLFFKTLVQDLYDAFLFLFLLKSSAAVWRRTSDNITTIPRRCSCQQIVCPPWPLRPWIQSCSDNSGI